MTANSQQKQDAPAAANKVVVPDNIGMDSDDDDDDDSDEKPKKKPAPKVEEKKKEESEESEEEEDESEEEEEVEHFGEEDDDLKCLRKNRDLPEMELEDFDIVALIGKGAFGKVFLARLSKESL